MKNAFRYKADCFSAFGLFLLALGLGGLGTKVCAQDPARQVYDNGMTLFHQQDYAGAIPYLNQALRINPHFGDAYLGLYMSRKFMGDTIGAIAELSTAMAMDSLSENSYIYWEARAKLYGAIGQYNKAIADYQTAIRKCPRCHQNHWEIGQLYFQMQNYEKAIEYFTKAIPLLPWNEDIYCKRGLAYYHLGNYTQACRDLEAAAGNGCQEAKYRLRAYFPTLADTVAAIFAYWR